MNLPAGTVIDRYRVEYVLGRGGMATVYAVQHTILGTRLALKVLHAASPQISERLVREGRVQARLDPRFVVPVMDVVSVHGSPALVMPLVVGCALNEVLEDHRLTEAEVLTVFGAVVRGVASAHAQGVIHRDLKPANVLLSEKHGRIQVRVADFGLARADDGAGDVATTTRAGVMMGTPAYAPPEQLRDAAGVDHRADLWSLGVLLFELLTGQRPFVGDSLEALCAAVLKGAFDRTAVPAAWRPLVDGLVRVDPAARLDAAETVLDHLDGLGAPARLGVGSPIAEVLRKRVAARPVPPVGAGSETFAEPGSEIFGDLGAATLGELSAADPAPPPPKHNLPTERDAFVGRAADLAELDQRLGDGAHLVSLLGMGGTGKTRLALHFAWSTLGQWPGGAWFCDLSEARDVNGIASAVARALDVPLGKGDPIVQLGHAIAGRGRCLVVLDNFEQVADHAPETLGHWLDRTTDAQFVVTTREVLGLPGETALPLAPLIPDESVDLFITRARQAKPAFEPTDRASIESLVTLLDGLPLAIELAAARVRLMPPKTLLSRMSKRFKILASRGGRHARHATLRAALDWSWDLLDADEQAALAQVSVFEGGFTLEAAEGVLALDELWPMDAVQALVDKSLVRQVADDRFDLLVSVQEYAAEKLDAAAGREDAEACHGGHFATFGTDEAVDALRVHGGFERQRALVRELDNLVAACRRAAGRADAGIAVPCLRAAWEALELKGPYTVAVGLADGVGAVASLTPAERQSVHGTWGRALRWLGRMDEARAQLEAALAIARELGHRRSEGVWLGNLGKLHNNQGRMDEARAHYETALAIGRELGDRRFEGSWLGNLGILHWQQGRMDEALEHYEAALAIARELGDRHDEGLTLGNLGILHSEQGRLDEARRHYETALAIARELGDRRSEGIWLGNLGILHNNQGRMDEAHAHLEAALAIAREVGNRRFVSIWLGNLGNLDLEQGRMDEARAHLEAALAIAREVGDRRFVSVWLGHLGNLHLEQGRMDEARAHYEAALAIAREMGDRRFEGLGLAGLGRVAGATGTLDEAREHFATGEALLRAVGDKGELGQLLAYRAEALAEADRPAATADLAAAEALATELKAGPDSELGTLVAKVRAQLDEG